MNCLMRAWTPVCWVASKPAQFAGLLVRHRRSRRYALADNAGLRTVPQRWAEKMHAALAWDRKACRGTI